MDKTASQKIDEALEEYAQEVFVQIVDGIELCGITIEGEQVAVYVALRTETGWDDEILDGDKPNCQKTLADILESAFSHHRAYADGKIVGDDREVAERCLQNLEAAIAEVRSHYGPR